MKKKEIYPETINVSERIPFFHNIPGQVLESIFIKNNKKPSVFLFSLNNAYVSPFGSVFKNGKVINESIYQVSGKNIRSNFFSFCNKIFRNKVRKIEGDCVVISHSWYQNYYHWMIEIVPRLFLMKDNLADKKLIIHKNVSKFHLEILQKFNFKEVIFIEDHELAKCDTISFTSFPNHYSNQHFYILSEKVKLIELNINIALMKELRQWFLQNNLLLKNNTSTQKNKIYISRKKAGYRKILNEAALEQILEKEGFIKVFLEDLLFDEQVQLLNSSNIVVSIHGAGLTNILFMEPKTHVINLISEHHYEFCYLTIATVADINYTHINCKGTKKENPAYNDITIDLEVIQKVLGSISSQSK